MDKKQSYPLVSIGIPAYNHAEYVQETIRSILMQDYPCIELIVIDDGSSDGTWDKIKAMKALSEERLYKVLLIHQDNHGSTYTCRRLIDLFSGCYYMLIASDDMLMPGAISALVQPMLEDKSIGVITGVNIIIDSQGRRCYWDNDRQNVYEKRFAKWLNFNDYLAEYTGIADNNPLYGTYAAFTNSNHIVNGWLVRTSISKSFPRNSKSPPLEDLWFHLQMSKITRYANIGKETFCYRWHQSNTMHQIAHVNEMATKTWKNEIKEVFASKDKRLKFIWLNSGIRLKEFKFGKIFQFVKSRNYIAKFIYIRIFDLEKFLVFWR